MEEAGDIPQLITQISRLRRSKQDLKIQSLELDFDICSLTVQKALQQKDNVAVELATERSLLLEMVDEVHENREEYGRQTIFNTVGSDDDNWRTDMAASSSIVGEDESVRDEEE